MFRLERQANLTRTFALRRNFKADFVSLFVPRVFNIHLGNGFGLQSRSTSSEQDMPLINS